MSAISIGRLRGGFCVYWTDDTGARRRSTATPTIPGRPGRERVTRRIGILTTQTPKSSKYPSSSKSRRTRSPKMSPGRDAGVFLCAAAILRDFIHPIFSHDQGDFMLDRLDVL